MNRSLTALEIAQTRANAIRNSDLDLYDPTLPQHTALFFEDHELEAILNHSLIGKELSGPNRTRSKLAKEMVASALGYIPPSSFRRTRPRFPGQNLEVRVQLRDNLQIYNEEISPERRYVLIRPDAGGLVAAVRVVRGQQVAAWDQTGTLTSKFQAKRKSEKRGSSLVCQTDTISFIEEFQPAEVSRNLLANQSSGERPLLGTVLSIEVLYKRLLSLVGAVLPSVGAGQDRSRGELLQAAVAAVLNIGNYENHGQWPDIVSQALEVKLQTSPTIDLGLVLPTDDGVASAISPTLTHADARYLVAYGSINADRETLIEQIVVVTGAEFFEEFEQFGGLIKNEKLQIPLPKGLFETKR